MKTVFSYEHVTFWCLEELQKLGVFLHYLETVLVSSSTMLAQHYTMRSTTVVTALKRGSRKRTQL
jgi:hypothetical protein